MQRRHLLILILVVMLATIFPFWRSTPDVPDNAADESLKVSQALGGQAEQGFERADKPRQFVFPQDHGPHPEFKTEWWYYTGNLVTKNERRFGYQLTFFRSALTPEPAQRETAWATNQVYMAHFAITDPQAGRFYHFERFSRDSLELAGATAEPFKVWLEDWRSVGEPGEPMIMRLEASEGQVAIDLQLQMVKPIVLQGQEGLSQKSAEPGNASYYYSMTRLQTTGSVEIAGQKYQVTGNSWLDREWSTSALGEDQVGWDWFSLQFDDGRELMYYQLRLQDGSADSLSSGVLVDVDGSSTRLRSTDVIIDVLDHWQSTKSGSRYPARWKLKVPKAGIDVEITPLLADQELHTTVRYWEGAVSVRGQREGEEMAGHGYVELTGY